MKDIVTCAIIIFSALSFVEQMTGPSGMRRGGGAGIGNGGMGGYPSRRSNYRDM